MKSPIPGELNCPVGDYQSSGDVQGTPCVVDEVVGPVEADLHSIGVQGWCVRDTFSMGITNEATEGGEIEER